MSAEDKNFNVEGLWGGDNYKKAVQRVEDGFQFCSEFSKIVQERAEIEGKYAAKLQSWKVKWTEYIEKGSEYGTCKEVLLGSFNEAVTISETHNHVVDKLTDLQNEIKKWKGEFYKKHVMMGACKEAKSFEDDFKKAQKPWHKLLGKIQKYSKEKESLEKSIRNLEILVSSEGDQSTNKKSIEKIEKNKKELDVLENKISKIEKELRLYKPIYIEDMEDIFSKMQQLERKRLQFIKDTLIRMHSCLDLSRNDSIPVVHVKWRNKIETLDPDEDIQNWACDNGVGDAPIISTKNICRGFNEKYLEPTIQRAQNTQSMMKKQKYESIKKPQEYNEELNPFGEDDEQNEDHKSDVSQTKTQEVNNASLNETPAVLDSSNSSLTSNSGLSNSTPAIPHAVEANVSAKVDAELISENTNDQSSISSNSYRASIRRNIDDYNPELNPFGV